MTKQISKLTPAQERQMIQLRDKWLSIGRSTKPLDTVKVEEVITKAYETILDQPRPVIVHCQSPWQMAVMPSCYRELAKFDDKAWEQVDELNNNNNNLWSNLWNNLSNNLWNNLWNNLSNNLRTNLWNNLRTNLWNNLSNNLSNNLRTNLRTNLWNNLRTNLWNNLSADVWNDYLKCWESLYGIDDLAYFDFGRTIGCKFTPDENNRLDIFLSLAEHTYSFISFKGVCFVSERPVKLNIDLEGRLHSENEEAMLFSDGYCLYCWHGVQVPDWVILHPEQITIEKIDNEQNAEVRRVMITRFGVDRYAEAGELLHQDDFGKLYRREVKDDEPVVMVKVVNSTPEPDGTYKDYFLRVHPELSPMLGGQKLGDPQKMTAKNAVASTFGMRGEEYDLAFQS